MTMNQKKALYAFGSPDREATVNRFCTLAELAPDPAVKRFFLAIAREMNSARWFWIAIGYQTLFAYACSLCIYQVGTWVTTGVFTPGTVIACIMIIGFIYLLIRPERKVA